MLRSLVGSEMCIRDRHSTVDPFHYIMLLLTPLFPLSHCTFSHCNHAHTFSAVVLFLISIYAVPLTHIVYTSSHKVLNLYVIQLFMCTSPPCSLQSLSLDLLNKMSTSLAQNKTMVKLTMEEDIYYRPAQVQVQDGKLFFHHLLLGLSGNNTLTDLTLSFRGDCWDWPEGELNVLHC